MALPETSRKAWEEQPNETRQKQNYRILEALDASGDGLTSDELEQLLELPHQTVSAYVSHLRAGWRIEDSGARKPTRHGRAAIVWKRRREPQTIEETLADFLFKLRATQGELARAERKCLKISSRVAVMRREVEKYMGKKAAMAWMESLTNLGMLQRIDEGKGGCRNG